MLKTAVEPVETVTWEGLRMRATVLGIPAWKLAEDLGVHELDDLYQGLTQAAKVENLAAQGKDSSA